MSTSSDRELLHGLIALQNHFVDQNELLAAFHLWCEDRSRTLVQILFDRKSLDSELARTLELLASRHLARFGNDAGRSLAALGPHLPEVANLSEIPATDLQASLALTGKSALGFGPELLPDFI